VRCPFSEYGSGYSADLNFCSIEPAGMLRCVVPIDSVQDLATSFLAQCFQDSFLGVGIQVVGNENDLFGMLVFFHDQTFNESGGFRFPTLVGYLNDSFTTFWFDSYEQVHGTVTLIFVVFMPDMTGSSRSTTPRCTEQLVALLVKADDRVCLVIRPFVD